MSVRPARRSRLATLLLAAPLAACASSPAATRAPLNDPMANMPSTTRIEGTAGTAEVRTYTSAAATTETAIPATQAKVFAALPTVFDALGIPVNTIVSDAGTFGAREARMPRQLGKAPLSRYIDCGSNGTGAPNADSYAVTMTVLSRVVPTTEGASAVTTQLQATARPITVSGNTLQCSSTGRLEEAINKRLLIESAR